MIVIYKRGNFVYHHWGFPYTYRSLAFITNCYTIKLENINKIISYLVRNSYLSHRFIDRFPSLLQHKIIRLKPVLPRPSGQSHGLTKLVLSYRFYFDIRGKLAIKRCSTDFSAWLIQRILIGFVSKLEITF